MEIVITGTRGIPARYGGFETFAQELALRLRARGHEMTVHAPLFHPYREISWRGIRIVRKPWPSFPGGVLWYDRLCLEDAYRRRPGVILNCGYGNALFIRRDHPVPVVTLTDGLEWQRAGWGFLARRWLRRMESEAVRRSRLLVSDHPVIARHFKERYGVTTPVIPYGATPVPPPEEGKDPVSSLQEYLEKAGRRLLSGDVRLLRPGSYFLMVARFVAENNLEMILEGFLRSVRRDPLLLVGDPAGRFGRRLLRRYGGTERFLFAGSLYDPPLLTLLRQHARGCFHGHSAGGTNPALLEAMAAGCLIAAHDNPFNRYILRENAAWFSTAGEVTRLLNEWEELSKEKESFATNNIERLRKEYDWEKITSRYEMLFLRLRKASGNERYNDL